MLNMANTSRRIVEILEHGSLPLTTEDIISELSGVSTPSMVRESVWHLIVEGRVVRDDRDVLLLVK